VENHNSLDIGPINFKFCVPSSSPQVPRLCVTFRNDLIFYFQIFNLSGTDEIHTTSEKENSTCLKRFGDGIESPVRTWMSSIICDTNAIFCHTSTVDYDNGIQVDVDNSELEGFKELFQVFSLTRRHVRCVRICPVTTNTRKSTRHNVRSGPKNNRKEWSLTWNNTLKTSRGSHTNNTNSMGSHTITVSYQIRCVHVL
jgi:hypothetical protein